MSESRENPICFSSILHQTEYGLFLHPNTLASIPTFSSSFSMSDVILRITFPDYF